MSIRLHPVAFRSRNRLAGYLHKVWTLAAKDIRTELRTKEIFGAMAAFSVLAIVIFGLAFDLRVPDTKMVVPGVLWVILLFGGVLGLNRSFGSEVEQKTLGALLLAPMERSAIFFGKVLGSFVMLIATQLLILPTILIIYDVNLFRLWIIIGLVLGVFGYTVVGALFAALTGGVRSRETLLPIMMLPVMVPLFLAGVGLTAAVLDESTFAEFRHWVGMLIAYDLLFVIICFLVFDLIWEDF